MIGCRFEPSAFTRTMLSTPRRRVLAEDELAAVRGPVDGEVRNGVEVQLARIAAVGVHQPEVFVAPTVTVAEEGDLLAVR
jgi:hypothetical protein